MGKESDEDITTVEEEGDEKSNTEKYLGSTSMIKTVLFYILAFILVALLIGTLVICKICLLPKCCTCFQKVARFALGKLMFNSVLRAFMQIFFITCLSMWTTFKEISTE